jgi:hypothetical protein
VKLSTKTACTGAVIVTAVIAVWLHRLGMSTANSCEFFFTAVLSVLLSCREPGKRPGTADPSGTADPVDTAHRADGRAEASHANRPLGAAGDWPVTPDTSQPARRATAPLRAGPALALLAATTGIVGTFLANTSGVATTVLIWEQCNYVVPAVVVLAALVMRGRREFMLALLLGTCSSSVAWVIWDITAAAADHLFAVTGRAFAGSIVETMSDVLGLAAAILMLAALRPAPEPGTRTGSRRVLLVLLLSAVACTQLGQYVLLTHIAPATANYAQAGALLITCVAVAWYATRLRARVPCGALLIGWALHKLFWLMANLMAAPARVGLPGQAGIFACVAAAAVLVLGAAYARARPYPMSRHRIPPDVPRPDVATA